MEREKDKQLWLSTTQINKTFKKQLEAADAKELEDMFFQEISFGTGGMRGIIGPGTNRINEITISSAAYSYGLYLKNKHQNAKIKIIIGYDNRLFSQEFARQVAEVLSAQNIQAALFSELIPTPIVSYAIRNLKAQGGIILTASHNPPEYNGMKFYDEHGCQMLPEAMTCIIEGRKQIADIFNIKQNKTYVTAVDKQIIKQYLEALKPLVRANEKKKTLKIGFSPQHGTAGASSRALFKMYGYNYLEFVKEQMVIDPYFSATKSANPEDLVAFEQLLVYGKKYQLDILLTTDPDADRLGVAYKDNLGAFTLLTGNQLGALLVDYFIATKEITATSYIVKTIVTSELGAQIAKKHGITVHNVLTGFKYIGDLIHRLRPEGFVAGYEESYGYLVHPIVRDKDAIQLLLAVCEMAEYYKQQGKTLGDRLTTLYQTYGYYQEALLSYTFSGVEGMAEIANLYDACHLIDWEDIISIEDYQKQQRLYLQSKQEEKIQLEKADVLKFYLEDGSWFCVRPSGTEPKLKIYLAVDDSNKEIAQQKLMVLKNRISQYIEEKKERTI